MSDLTALVPSFTLSQSYQGVPTYTLRGMDNPIGISSYELTRALPADLQSSLPSIEQIERALDGVDGVDGSAGDDDEA